MTKHSLRVFFTAVFLLLSNEGIASDSEEFSGGSTTVFQAGQNAYSLPLANISRENRRAHVIGNSFFNKNWIVAPASPTSRDGLGPLFHARSCSACHLRDGRGAPLTDDQPSSALLFRLSVPGKSETGSPIPDPTFGDQLAIDSIPNIEPEGKVIIEYETIKDTFQDGTTYTLERPIYQLVFSDSHGSPDPGIMFSPRIAPPLHGLGLLEAIPEKTILDLSDPEDSDGDGISGKPNRVWNPESEKIEVGRFGWKANQTDIRQQTAAAFLSDIGITSSVHPKESLTDHQFNLLKASFTSSLTPDLDDKILDRVVSYTQTLAPPARRDWKSPLVTKGKSLFHEARCSACHIPELKTASEYPALPELENQTIRPYTDLLLHDMGPELADHRPDFAATGTEWRTPPLWGIGLTETVNGHTRFLHDGRARNLEEAILWHGGEATFSREAYKALPAKERQALLAFLESL
ncbi:MAG: thiol oxidoreductase [Verrucomicrobiales bacterium]|nr:thiol oxidoreductase [Verrucomicrobiales bacterium]